MIVVTGVHRSGTSAVAMTLEALGVDFGPSDAFYGADAWNERGYFERTDVIDLNSRLLTGFARTTTPVSSVISQVRYLTLPSPRGVRRRARRLSGEIAELAQRIDGLAVKDPRFCLTMEAWHEHVSASIVCLRHPASVAGSLHRRQRVPLPLGLRFWDHHARALLAAPADTTLYVDFDALAGDETEGELSRVLRFLRLPVELDVATRVFRDQFAPELRHFQADRDDGLPDRTRALWSALQERRRS